jgi:hypothetical protein
MSAVNYFLNLLIPLVDWCRVRRHSRNAPHTNDAILYRQNIAHVVARLVRPVHLCWQLQNAGMLARAQAR